MKILTSLAVAGAVAITALPAQAAKKDSTTKVPTAQSQCRTERTQMGKTTFAQTYGTNASRSNAFGKCVSKRTTATAAARKATQTETEAAKVVKQQLADDVSAAKACRTERAADPAAFKTKYGTGRTKANAFGKCVSVGAKAKADARQAA